LQLQHWKNSITLFSHAVAVTENNWMAHNNLGKVILDEGRIDEAIMHFTKAVEANPSYALAYLNRGFAYYFKYDFPAAREAFERAIQADSSCHPAHFGLGLVYLGMGKRDLAQIEYGYLLSSGSPRTQELMTEILAYDSVSVAAKERGSVKSGPRTSTAPSRQ
jgi:protein O-mannosyl-transferase